MKYALLPLVMLLTPLMMQAEEALKSFDRLYKDNVTVKATTVKGGSSMDRKWKTTWGSFDRDTTQTRMVEVTASSRSETPLKAEMLGVFRTAEGGEKFSRGEVVSEAGANEWLFKVTATRNEQNYQYLGEKSRSGDKMIGWCVRIIRDGRIVGIAASAPALEKYASDASYVAN